jgi:cell division protein FtsL
MFSKINEKYLIIFGFAFVALVIMFLYERMMNVEKNIQPLLTKITELEQKNHQLQNELDMMNASQSKGSKSDTVYDITYQSQRYKTSPIKYSEINGEEEEENEEKEEKEEPIKEARRLTEKEKLFRNKEELIERCNTLSETCYSDDFSDIAPKKEEKKHIDINVLKALSRPELFNIAKELPIKKEKLGRHLTKDELSKLIVKTNKKNNKNI